MIRNCQPVTENTKQYEITWINEIAIIITTNHLAVFTTFGDLSWGALKQELSIFELFEIIKVKPFGKTKFYIIY